MAKKQSKSTGNKEARKNTGRLGSRKNPQDMLTQIIRGEGKMYKDFPTPRKGTANYAGVPGVFGSFDMKQAILNREAGLC